MVCMLSSFLLGYADLHHYAMSSLPGITAFIGFWQLAYPIQLQNPEQVRVNLTQEQNAVLHPVLQPH